MAKRPSRHPLRWHSTDAGIRPDYGIPMSLRGFALGWPSLPRPKRKYRGMPCWFSIDYLTGRFPRKDAE